MGDGFAYGSNVSSSGQPWTTAVTLSASGQNLSTLFGFYPTNGAVTIGTGTTSINTVQDGPIQVVRYGALTVNGTLTASSRCRGLCILCDSLAMGASGIITMSALGAAGSSKWVNQDIIIPTLALALNGKNTSYAAFLAYLASTGYAIFDPTLFACPPPGFGDVQANWSSWPGNGTAIISAAGCGAGASLAAILGNSGTSAAGNTGAAGTSGGLGGGGSGAVYHLNTSTGGGRSAAGAPGKVWGGGAASGAGADNSGALAISESPDAFGGPGSAASANASINAGGGAGNPGGAGAYSGVAGASGTGGVLIIVCRGNVNLTAGHAISANGVAGGNASSGCGGGGSGGGSASLFYLGSLTGSPNLTSTGGAGGTGAQAGGAGGAGSTQAKTFSAMGY